MKLSNIILILTSLFISNIANALDISKLSSSDFIGGSPKASNNARSISASGYPIGKPSIQDRTRRMPSKYGNTKGRSIMDLYQGSTHQRLLRDQKRAYAPSAKENERVFGAPYRKTSSKKISIEDLIKQGAIKVILGADGKKYLVQNK
tara:strand:- start:631 stop:1074 length:444 start_codon:yes stop_codon:yes gene_type:complete